MSHLLDSSRLGCSSTAQASGSGRHPAVLYISHRQRRHRGRAACRVEARAVEQVTTDQLKQTRLITAIKTPYLDNGKFNLPTFDRFVEHQVMHAVLLLAYTVGFAPG